MKTAIGSINALERRIVKAEDDADTMRWEQARQVVAQLDAGLTQRQLAAQWINARNGKPYSQIHVWFVKRVFDYLGSQTPRPRFHEAYKKIKNSRPTLQSKPLEFHWMNAADDLHRLCTEEAARWPYEARALLPQLLREVADRCERDNDVSRGYRAEGTSPHSNTHVNRHDWTAA